MQLIEFVGKHEKQCSKKHIGKNFKFSPNGVNWQVLAVTSYVFIEVILIKSQNGKYEQINKSNKKWSKEIILN